MRKGEFKAHFKTKDGYSKEPAQTHDPALLFNIARAPRERFDIAKEHPEVLASIQEVAWKHKEEVKPREPQY